MYIVCVPCCARYSLLYAAILHISPAFLHATLLRTPLTSARVHTFLQDSVSHTSPALLQHAAPLLDLRGCPPSIQRKLTNTQHARPHALLASTHKHAGTQQMRAHVPPALHQGIRRLINKVWNIIYKLSVKHRIQNCNESIAASRSD